MHATDELLTPFSYRIDSDGWGKWLDEVGAFTLAPSADAYEFLGVWPDPVIAAQDCRKAIEPGVGRTVDDIVTWLTEHEGIVATEPVRASVGGWEGRQLDLAIATDWTQVCATAGYDGPAVAFFVHDPDQIDDPGHFFIESRQEMRAVLLAGHDGHTVLIGINAEAGEPFDRFVDMATPVVESFEFGE
jgi:hypothetical protein